MAVQQTNEEALACRAALDACGILRDSHARMFHTAHQRVGEGCAAGSPTKLPSRPYAEFPPLMLRGTFVRTRAIDHALDEAIGACYEQGGRRPVQVLVLGAGFDTRWQRTLRFDARLALCVEVDLAEVVVHKEHHMSRPHCDEALALEAGSASLAAFTFGSDADGLSSRTSAPQCGCASDPRVIRIAKDLEDPSPLVLPPSWDCDAPAVVLAECVFMYISPDALGRVLANLKSQMHRQSWLVVFDAALSRDRFSETMTANFARRGITLFGHPSLETISAAWRLKWSRDMEAMARALPAGDRATLGERLALDEYEEWLLVSSHYRLAVYTAEGCL